MILFFLIFALQSLSAGPLAEQFRQVGYVEFKDQKGETETFNALYSYFDEFVAFLQTNPIWAQKIYQAKERFIRSKEKNYYSTDVFGFYDESERKGRNQIAFYYSSHFHAFIDSHYPELKIPEILRFLEACHEVQKTYGDLFNEATNEWGLEISCLIKVIKYLPSYSATRPHYDGSALSLFLDSTDNQALLLSPYRESYTVEDFTSPARSENSILLIPGGHLTEFSMYPTPHIVSGSGKVRYATIAFAMRPNYIAPKIEFSLLPSFKIE